jgi:hypothetical protein
MLAATSMRTIFSFLALQHSGGRGTHAAAAWGTHLTEETMLELPGGCQVTGPVRPGFAAGAVTALAVAPPVICANNP